jgi:excinuclease ABC subunit C
VDERQYGKDIDAAILFLEGKNRNVVNTFVKRMEQASAEQEYEQAARLRDQIARLKEIEAKQLVKRTDHKDLDILGFASNGAIHSLRHRHVHSQRLSDWQSRSFSETAG